MSFVADTTSLYSSRIALVLVVVLIASVIHYVAIDHGGAKSRITKEYLELGAREKRRIALLGWFGIVFVVANFIIASQLTRQLFLTEN